MREPSLFFRLSGAKAVVRVAYCIVALFVQVVALSAQPNFTIDLQPGKKLVLKETIFQEGKAEVNTTAIPIIEYLIVYLKSVPNLEIEISGHTDNQGNLQQNVKLSRARAEMVKSLLVKGGIGTGRIRTNGYAADFPIADNATEAGRAKNWRVEIVGISGVTSRALTTSDGHAVEPDGEITFLRNAVQTLAPWEQEWQAAAVRQPIYEYHKINTVEDSRAEVTFKDNSTLQIGENSLIVVYRPLQSFQSEGKPTENIGLVRGGLWMKLQEAKRGRGEALVVKTSAGEVSMSKAGKIGTDAQGRSLVSVHEGMAYIRYTTSEIATVATMKIPENFGTRLTVNTAPEKPRPLPPTPELMSPTPTEILATGPYQFKWRRASPKTRVEILEQSSKQPVVSQIISGDTFSFFLNQGSYILRLSGIDSIGLESKILLRPLSIMAAAPPPAFRLFEFVVLTIGAGLFWAGVLFKRKDARYAAILLWAIAFAIFSMN